MRTAKEVCPHCNRMIQLDDEHLQRGFDILLNEYRTGEIGHDDQSSSPRFFVILGSLHLTFEYGKGEVWRVHEAWVEVPYMNLHFSGRRKWCKTPAEAVQEVFNTARSSFEFASARNP